MLGVLGCPFCGEKPILSAFNHSHSSTEYSRYFELKCAKCDYRFVDRVTIVVQNDGVVKITHDGVKEMIDKWNRRVDIDG